MNDPDPARTRLLSLGPVLLVVAAATLSLGAPVDAGAPGFASLGGPPPPEARRTGGKGIARGLFELWTEDPLRPHGWRFTASSGGTAGGSGVEYLIFTSSHVMPGPANPSLVTRTVYPPYNATTSLGTWSDAVNFIVSHYAHVGSASDLTVYAYDVSVP